MKNLILNFLKEVKPNLDLSFISLTKCSSVINRFFFQISVNLTLCSKLDSAV